jgi:hypothetical protein
MPSAVFFSALPPLLVLFECTLGSQNWRCDNRVVRERIGVTCKTRVKQVTMLPRLRKGRRPCHSYGGCDGMLCARKDQGGAALGHFLRRLSALKAEQLA